MGQADGRGISRSVADARYGQPMVLSPIVALPFNHVNGVNTDDTTNAVFKALTWVNIFKLTEATDHLIFGFDNFHTNTSAGETNGLSNAGGAGGFFTHEKVAVYVRAASGSATFWGPTYATFNGNESYGIWPRTRVFSDPVPTGLLPAGTEIQLRDYTTALASVQIPTGRLAGWGSQGYVAGDATATVGPSLTSYAGHAPFGIYAYRDTWSGLSLIGDSRIAGTGETTGLTGGWAARGCYARDIGTTIAAHSGEKIQEVAATYTARQNRLALMGTTPFALLGYGVNDLTAGRTLAQVIADFNVVIAELHQLGVRSIIPTILPYTQSSDGFATASGQSRNASFSAQAETDRQSFNAILRDPATAASTFAAGYWGYVDPCEFVCADASNNRTALGDRYFGTGSTGTGAYTTDGLHLNTLGSTTAQAAITADLANIIRRGVPAARISQLLATIA
jgi:hypothetical protein